VAGGGDTRDARELLAGLIGRPIQTISGARNQVLEVRADDVVVATVRSPRGQPVPIASVQDALDRIQATGELQIDPPTVGYRSAFVGAVLRTLPNARIEQDPQRILLRRSPADWDLPVGARLSRSERKARFGGAIYGGIEPSARSPNVFLYSDPSRGETYGYNYDGWADDGRLFLYTGEGREGDQPMSHGNRAILEHQKQGRALRLFVADGQVAGTAQREQRYVGEFQIDPSKPYSIEDAPDESGEQRTVFVFRLRPVGEALRREGDQSTFPDVSADATASLVPIERNAETSFDVAMREGTTATRREGELVDRFIAWSGRAERFSRWRLRPPGELRPLLTDIYSETQNVLYEAKGTATRNAMRTAIGQLLDYRRHIDRNDLRLAVLMPHLPAGDLIEFATGLGIAVVAEQPGGGFETVERGTSGRPSSSLS
jgi:5-methylcytosine-specific restriction protein A